jgi:hypothetical protein
MGIGYRLVMYDRQTDAMIESNRIKKKLISGIKKVAQIPADDDGAGDYQLDAAQAHQIGKILGISVSPEKFDYFVEPYE